MDSGKAITIGAILKLNRKVFRASHIHQVTDLSRSLVTYHLNQMVEKGLLIKDGKYFIVHDRDGLIQTVTDTQANKIEMKKPSRPIRFLPNIERLGTTLDFIVAMREAKFNYAAYLTSATNADLDEAIKTLESAKRYLNRKQYGTRKVLQIFESATAHELWEGLAKRVLLEEDVDEETFTHELDICLGELRDNGNE